MTADVSWQINRFPRTEKKKMVQDGLECVVFVQQPRTENRNVAIALNGCAGTTLSRQFK